MAQTLSGKLSNEEESSDLSNKEFTATKKGTKTQLDTTAVLYDINGNSYNVNNPIPTDGDSIYSKDVWVDECDMGDFSGLPTDIFDNLHSIITNTTANNPKSITIHFNRGVITTGIALGAFSGDFSNVKIKLLGSGHVGYTIIDDSSNNTKYTGRAYQFPIVMGFNAITIEFHTADAVTLSNCSIGKTGTVLARLQAVNPSDEVVDINATTGGNLKMSIEEYDDVANPVRKNMEGGGKISVGTTAVEVTFTGITKSIIITADKDNTGVLYIGESNVTNIGANAITFLESGDSLTIDYDDIDNAVYVVSDTSSQYFWKGATL